MKVFYRPGSERLLDILASAVWHYRRRTEEIINSRHWGNVEDFLEERKIIDTVVKAAVDNPAPGSNFAVRCRDGREFLLIRKILEHYLSETRDVLDNINEPLIAGKCREDVGIIRNHMMQAVH